jgi:cytochrome P450
MLGAFVLARYESSKYMEMNPEIFTAEAGETTMRRTMNGSSMIDVDDPQHALERGPVNSILRPKAIKQNWTGAFRENTRFYLDRLADAGPDGADLNRDVAAPLAAKNLIDLLGLRDIGAEDVRRWSSSLIEGISNVADDPEVWARVDVTRAEIDANLAELAPYLRRHPDNSFASAMAQAGLPDDVVAANVRLAISGGINEPQHAITSMVWALSEHPEQRDAVLADPDLWPAVFEETLRWVSPLGFIPRRAVADTEVEGVTIPAGSTVIALISSANHDESVYDDAERFDIHRSAPVNFAFGGGVHVCAGMWAARWSVGGIALPMLYERFAGLRTDDRRPSGFVGFAARGLPTHPVTWDRDGGHETGSTREDG